MLEQKITLNVIDGTIKDVEDIHTRLTDVLKRAKDDLISLESEKDYLKREKTSLENEKTQLEREKTSLESEKKQLEREKTQLEREKTQLEIDKNVLEDGTRKLEREKQERDDKIGAMSEEQMRLLEEYKKVKVELQKFARIATEMEEQDLDFDRIQALLSIYSVLLEKIFQGQPHFRILYAIHFQKEEMTREELKMTTGIQGAMVLRAVQELDKVDLLEYDMDTGISRLKKRLFPKPTKEEKNS